MVHWVDINDGSYGTYKTGSPTKFKTSKIRSSLCDYSDPYILAKGTLTVKNTGTVAVPNSINKKWYLKIVVHLLIA